jgi:hypothetical protein
MLSDGPIFNGHVIFCAKTFAFCCGCPIVNDEVIVWCDERWIIGRSITGKEDGGGLVCPQAFPFLGPRLEAF